LDILTCKRPLIVIEALYKLYSDRQIGVEDSKCVTVFDPLLSDNAIWRIRRRGGL